MADIVLDRSAPPRLRRLRLSALTATAGVAFSAEVLDRTPGTELRLTGNPGGRYQLTGTTLTGKGLSRGVDSPAITELPGTSGALGPRETEFAIVVAHDPTIPAFTRPTTPGASSPTISGTLAAATLGQPYDQSFIVTPAGTPVSVNGSTPGQSHSVGNGITHNGYGRFTSPGVTA